MLLDNIVARARIVEHDRFDAVVGRVALVVHGIRNVRYIVASVGLARDVDLAVVEREGVNKVLPEPEKLIGDFDFVRCGWSAVLLAESGACWLLNPDDICEVHPGLYGNRQRAPIN